MRLFLTVTNITNYQLTVGALYARVFVRIESPSERNSAPSDTDWRSERVLISHGCLLCDFRNSRHERGSVSDF